ncbi:hypothetical protein QOZ80_2AG0141450 [Eleusine coracana subsp. coracana]|nr:hypothetical protein QOZ80_2AG0141450 [Eleusine coracana subsp. coracana]
MGMRCKKHPFQAAAGVCATCLRDRLLVLAAAQNGGDASSSPPPQLPPVVPAAAFPRSVSPYVSRRKSDASGGGALRNHPSLLFFRTPQVGPAGSGALEEGDIAYEVEKRRAGKFSVLATLFGHHHHHRSDDKDKGRGLRGKKHSWLAGIIPRRRKKQQPPESSSSSALPPSPPPARRSCRVVSNRGLSPERNSHGSDEESSSPAWRPSPSPMRKPTPGRRPRQASSMPSGFAVCLSPLVRPSPGRRHRGGAQPPDPCSFSCELRPSPLHNLASITRCRSKKLADGGRFR